MDTLLTEAKHFPLVFVPLFVAMDPIGLLPFWVSLTRDMAGAQRSRVSRTALITGLAVGLAFLGLGRGLFSVLGITVSDFLVAGGLILLVLSLRELLQPAEPEHPQPDELLAVVPIGTPLLVGPATISMLLLLTGLYATWLVILSFLLNLGVAWLLLALAVRLVRMLGRGGLRAISRVAYLLLAAIAVQLIRTGVTDMWGTG